MKNEKCIAIIGRKKDTTRYEDMLRKLGIDYITTLHISKVHTSSHLLLPGGGDITPAFFGKKNAGSQNIDTELDILQLQALEYAVREKKPVLGICKGMQVINVFFGGTILQDMPNAASHRYLATGDQMHDTTILPDTFLSSLYGESLVVNSAHHQCIEKLGKELVIAQYAHDHTPEALYHKSLPVYGVQWHPERLENNGEKLFYFFCDSL